MRQAHKVWSAIAAGVFVIVAITDLAGSAPRSSSVSEATAERVTPPVRAVAAPPVETRVPTQPEDPDPVVTRVLDGDTIELDTGETVQILGIDACELGTHGGDEAADLVRGQLEGEPVTLRAEPGVTTDRHGFALRYVSFAWGGDVAEYVVGYPHTTVYDGHGAPPAYLDGLRYRDDGAQRCTAPAPVAPYGGDGGSIDWPTPGDQGLPDGLLTGGYCARKWWC